MLLVLYPFIAGETFATFDCVQLRGTYLLRRDPSLECFTSEYAGRVSVALVSIVVYCVGIPIALFLTTRRYVSLRGDRRRLNTQRRRPKTVRFHAFGL